MALYGLKVMLQVSILITGLALGEAEFRSVDLPGLGQVWQLT